MPGKKVLLIRAENSITKLILGFFPDIYIHDIKLEIDDRTGDMIMHVYFLSFEERIIAIGRGGTYIKAVNEIFDKYIIHVKIKYEIKQEKYVNLEEKSKINCYVY